MSGDELMFHIIYPENRRVSASKILGWYADAVASCELDGVEQVNEDIHPVEAARLLEDAGLITVASR